MTRSGRAGLRATRAAPVSGQVSDPGGRSRSLRGLLGTAIGRNGQLAHTSAHLMISTLGTALIGLAFWGAAAHLFSTDEVGVGSAEISAMSLIASFAQLNLANGYVRFLPVAGDQTSRLIRHGYLLCLGTAAVVVTVFVVTPGARELAFHGWQEDVLFVLSVLLWTMFILQDGVLTGLRRAPVVPIENIGFALAKLLLLPLFALVAPEHGVFFAWTLPVVPAVGLVTWVIARHVRRPRAATSASRAGQLPRGAELRSFLSAEYAHSLVSTSSMFLLPVVIEAQRGARAEAHFYIPWLVYTTSMNLFANVSSGMVLEVAGGAADVSAVVRRGLVIMGALATVAVVICIALPRPILVLFSTGYGTAQAVDVMRWIGVSMPFDVLAMLLGSYLWIERRIWWLVAARLLQAAVLVGGAELLLKPLGIAGAGLALVLSSASVMPVGLPLLVRWYRGTTRAHPAVPQGPQSDQTITLM